MHNATMVKSKWKAASLGGSPEEVEAAFYEALQTGHLEQFMACWSDDEDIVCVHPAGARVVGHEAIRQTFANVFESGELMVTPEHIRKISSMTSSVHNVIERIRLTTAEGLNEVFVVATNVYHRTPLGWRIVLHHASAASKQDLADVPETPTVLH